MRARDISSAKQKIFLDFGQQTSVRNCISLILTEMLLHTCSIKTGACDVMHIKIKVSIPYNIVVKNPCIENILLIKCIFTLEMSCFSDPHKRSGADNITILISGNKFTEIFYYICHLSAAGKRGPCQVICICAVNINCICHITGNNTGKS